MDSYKTAFRLPSDDSIALGRANPELAQHKTEVEKIPDHCAEADDSALSGVGADDV